MKKYIIVFLLLLSTIGYGQKLQKLAQTGMKFLSVATDPRASAMGDAVTALEGNSNAMFFNPATMAYMNNFASIALGRIDWIADIQYKYGSMAFSPRNGYWGVFGISAVTVDYGIFIGTVRDDDPTNELGYVETGNFSPNAMALGFGYAKALSDKFAVGGNVKYVIQDFGSTIVGISGAAAEGNFTRKSYSKNVLAFDFGILYHTGFKSLNFGMCVRNFSQEVKYEAEGFQLPLTFKIGLSMNVVDIYPTINNKIHSLLVAVEAVHPRDYPEQINIGLEYVFLKMFALRAGYSAPNDEHGFSFGGGLQQSLRNYNLAVDYAYTPFGVFESVHRFSLHFGF